MTQQLWFGPGNRPQRRWKARSRRRRAGDDKLSGYITDAFRNRLATFVRKRAAYYRLSAVDQCFAKVSEGWLNPPDPISPLLFLRAHASYRASCEHALAGQSADLYPQLRACLENAGYALLIGRRPDLARIAQSARRRRKP